MRRRLTIGLAGALGALALLPGAAAGSTAMLGGGDTLDYNAAAGETNNLTVEQSGANFVLTDTGAAITPTLPCAAVTANQVTCPAAPVTDVDISLGDLNDTGTIASSVAGKFDGNTTMDGQDGNDTLVTNAPLAEFLLFGGLGEDSLTGSPGRDRLIGGDGNDIHLGNGGPDRFDEGEGNDIYDGGAGDDDFGQTSLPRGADTFIGGAGEDDLDFQSRNLALTIDLDGVADDGEGCPGAGCEGDNVMADVENLNGGPGNDSITGAAGAQQIRGNSGNDTIDGGSGDDDLSGDDGDDSVMGGEGNDDVNGDEGADVSQGGPGDDQIGGNFNDAGADSLSGGTGLDSTFAFSNSPVQVDLDGVADDGPIGGDVPKDNVLGDIENVETGIGDDVLIGNGSANELIGGAGDDTLIGRGGADGLFGDDGNDTIDGGTDVDTLDGGAGTDALRSRDNSADQVDCGSSLDTVLADLLDDPEPSCEILSGGVVIAKSAKADKKGQSAKLKVSCPELEGIDCKVKVTLKAKGKKVASGKGTVPSGGSKQVKLKLTGDGAKALADGKLKTDAKATFTDVGGAKVTSTRKVTLG